MDATHPHHNPVVACGWIKKGHEFELRSNTGSQRLNINGVINIQNLDAVTRYNRYYETFTEFKQACENFFANAKDHAVALKSLLTENFHIIGKIQN